MELWSSCLLHSPSIGEQQVPVSAIQLRTTPARGDVVRPCVLTFPRYLNQNESISFAQMRSYSVHDLSRITRSRRTRPG